MSALKPCPCGETPKQLHFFGEVVQRKYGLVMGSCCNDWLVEFHNRYEMDPDKIMANAIAAWNENPRGKS